MNERFRFDTDPESVAARAAELALEQNDRLRPHLKAGKNAAEFYGQSFEISISNRIANMMSAYAVLKGYVTYERAQGRETPPSHV